MKEMAGGRLAILVLLVTSLGGSLSSNAHGEPSLLAGSQPLYAKGRLRRQEAVVAYALRGSNSYRDQSSCFAINDLLFCIFLQFLHMSRSG